MFLFAFVIAEAFIGYVLPWGQMSVWGACVITRLLGVIPYVGEIFVVWVWGGFVVSSATLGCFFAIHFVLPFAIFVLVGIHILFLHETGSTRGSGRRDRELKVKLFPFFVVKDMVNFLVWFCFISGCMLFPFSLGDCENLKEANLISRPVHIQPEWYFLSLYAILRAIPNKLGGVLALAAAVVCVGFLSLFPGSYQRNTKTCGAGMVSLFVIVLFLLT